MSYFDPPDKTQSVLAPLHPNLPPLPLRLKSLPVDARGYPVPWFVEWFHADGKPASISLPPGPGDYPDFRVISMAKMARAYRDHLCWICGQRLGKFLAFVIGPMCAVNRTSGEPPSHRECAVFAATACPFLTKPLVERREGDMPEDARMNPAHLDRNPGVAMVWLTNDFEPRVMDTGVVFRMGDPIEVKFYREGRPAVREEIMHSIDTGMPFLREMAEKEGPLALRLLQQEYEQAIRLVPA
jgi:hypothetical protein